LGAQTYTEGHRLEAKCRHRGSARRAYVYLAGTPEKARHSRELGSHLGDPAKATDMQIDQYWNARDPKSGMTPRQEACDGKPGKDGIKQTVAKEVAKIGSRGES
jgi:hypothetical protein